MARIRTIKPEFWTSEQVMECSPNARLLFIGMWNFADDQGRMTNSARRLKALIFPSDDFSSANVQGMLAELSANDLLLFYEHEGLEYIQITGWKHQKIDHAQPSKFPPPPPNARKRAGHSPNDRRTFAPEGNGRERKGEEYNSESSSPKPRAPERFDDDEKNQHEKLLATLCEAAGIADDQQFPGLQITGPITDMVEVGWSMERHILPGIRAVRAAKLKAGNARHPSSWEYFAKAIKNGAEAPPKAKPPPAGANGEDGYLAKKQRIWRQQLAHWTKTGDWSTQWGAAPGSAGSEISAEFIAAFKAEVMEGAAA